MMEQDISRERTLELAKLLFRAAAWVSTMDEAGGGNSRLMERNAIREKLKLFSREPHFQTLVPIFQMILDSHKAWDQWSENFSTFTLELKKAAPDLSLELRQCIYDLSYSVATRYRERSLLMAFFASIHVSLRNFFRPNIHGPELPAYLNISTLEKSALNELAEILDMPQRLID